MVGGKGKKASSRADVDVRQMERISLGFGNSRTVGAGVAQGAIANVFMAQRQSPHQTAITVTIANLPLVQA
jgi:hypothetical protein